MSTPSPTHDHVSEFDGADEMDTKGEAARKRRTRSLAIALCLVGFIALVFVLTLVRLKEQALAQL